MIAMGVLVLGIGGVLAIFLAAGATHRRALDETTAAIVAEGVLADIRAEFSRSYTVEPRPSEGPFPAPAFPLFTFRVDTTIIERDPTDGRAVQAYVEAVVIWQRKGKERQEVYRTIMFRE